MNNKGFTLIELLALLAIISFLLLLGAPNIINQIESSKKINYDNFIGDLCLASESYISHNDSIEGLDEFKEEDDLLLVSVGDLINGGYVKSNLKNPRTKELLLPTQYIIVRLTSDMTYSCSLEEEDDVAPTLNLSKITYKEGFDGWTFNNAHVDNNGVLILGENGESASANSNYYQVNGQPWYYTWDGYTTTESSSHSGSIGSAGSGSGGILTAVSYFNESYTKVLSNNGYDANGYDVNLPLNTWSNNFSFDGYGGYGDNVKYLKIRFSTGNQYSQPITKIRNLKVYGQMPNSFYLINVNATDNIGIVSKKYEKGEKDKKYFKKNGNLIRNNQIRVTENGTYTVYVKDVSGNEAISTITIDNIEG